MTLSCAISSVLGTKSFIFLRSVFVLLTVLLLFHSEKSNVPFGAGNLCFPNGALFCVNNVFQDGVQQDSCGGRF